MTIFNTSNIFFILFRLGTNSTAICGSAKILCYETAEMLLYGELEILNRDGSQKDEAGSFREKCNCLPSCTSISYKADIDRAKLNYIEAEKARYKSFSRTDIG